MLTTILMRRQKVTDAAIAINAMGLGLALHGAGARVQLGYRNSSETMNTMKDLRMVNALVVNLRTVTNIKTITVMV